MTSPPTRRLAIDAANVTAGGARTSLRALLTRADLGPFEEIAVIGGPGCEEMLGVTHPKLRYVEDPALPPAQWRGSGLVDLPAYLASVWRVQRWREVGLPRRIAELRADVLYGANGLLPRHPPPRVRSVVVSHNMLPFDAAEARRFGWGLQRLRLLLLRRRQAHSFRNADAVMFLSEHARREISRIAHLDRDRIGTCVIYNGVDHALFHPRDGSEGEGRDPSDILYVSSIDRYKHHDAVVRAFADLRARTGRPLRLHFAGWEHPAAVRAVRGAIDSLGLGDAITLHGVLPAPALAELYRRADLFVFASTCENCPTILIEAMASGLPIACTDRPPMTELTADAAITFDPEDPATILRALMSLIEDGALRRRLREAALRRAKDFFWDKTAQEIYAFLADGPRQPNSYGP